MRSRQDELTEVSGGAVGGGVVGRPVRVVLVDDQPLIRNGLHALLAADDRIEVVGEAEDGHEAVRVTRMLHPDVVLMDITMPRMNGVEATRELLQGPRPDPAAVLMLSVHEHDKYIFEALRAGASGFLLKTSPTEKVIEAVRTVASGESILSPSVTTKLIGEFARTPVTATINAPELVQLTDREFDVFRFLVCGHRNDEIARELRVGESTVKSHVQHLYQKLGVRDRVHVVIYAYEHGLLRPGVGWSPPTGS
jgi:DNA-binding NarL/FixJ family response regulator